MKDGSFWTNSVGAEKRTVPYHTIRLFNDYWFSRTQRPRQDMTTDTCGPSYTSARNFWSFCVRRLSKVLSPEQCRWNLWMAVFLWCFFFLALGSGFSWTQTRKPISPSASTCHCSWVVVGDARRSQDAYPVSCSTSRTCPAVRDTHTCKFMISLTETTGLTTWCLFGEPVWQDLEKDLIPSARRTSASQLLLIGRVGNTCESAATELVAGSGEHQKNGWRS